MTVLHDAVEDPAGRTVADVLAAHAQQLAAAIASVGVAEAAEAAGCPVERIDAIADGDVDAVGDLDLEAAARLLALPADASAAEAIAAEAREALLFGMTAGVLSVDVVAVEAPIDVEPREVQAMLEGRRPMSLREYVALQRVIEGASP
ncbi:MAG: DUF5791 family protein [Halobacteriales archaeon]